MANRLQLRKGTTAQNTAFTGANGELTYDTQKKQIRVHDGSTVGGKIIDDTARDVTGQVKQATESLAGKAKIATTALTQAGTNNTDFITPKKLLDFIKSNVIKNDFVDVTSSRVRGVTYTNPSSSSYLNIRINATITGTGGRISVFVNDKLEVKTTTSGGGSWGETIFLLVPPLGTYRLEGTSSIVYWGEA